jgi:hypothetical protein
MLYLPHFPVTIFQLNRGGLGWLAPPDIYWLFDFFWQWLNHSWLIVAVFLSIFFTIILRIQRTDLTSEQKLGFATVFISVIAGYLLSYLLTPVMRELVMLYVLPFLLLPLFSLRSLIVNERNQLFGIGVIVFLVGAHSIFVERLYQQIHFGVFRELGKEINSRSLISQFIIFRQE